MPDRNQAALDFLLTRRSRPAKTMTGPAPDRAALHEILTAGLRSPDHGKLEPWRLIVLEKPALARLAQAVRAKGTALGLEDWKTNGAAQVYDEGLLAVAVVASPKEGKIPEIEQTYSAGAVCLALLNAAQAAGWAANWLSGWPSHNAEFCAENFGLAPHERIAGLIFMGTETSPPPDRPRPDLDRIVTWVAG
jgi:nitroreductase